MATDTARIADLRPDPANPRYMSKHDADALKRSLKEFGAVEPAVVNADGTIIGGHMRVAAAEQLGWETFPVVRVDLPPEKARLLNLALNRISGEWDEAKLSEMVWALKDDAGIEALVGLSGFTDEELTKLLGNSGGEQPAPPEPTLCPDCGKELR